MTSNSIMVEAWYRSTSPSFDVVGESYYYQAIRALLPPIRSEYGEEIQLPLTLVHDPSNPYDPNAIDVVASTGKVASFSQEDAERYAPTLAKLQRAGVAVWTTGRIWGGRHGDGSFYGSVRLCLEAPSLLLPVNDEPSDAVMLPPGKSIKPSSKNFTPEPLAPYVVANDGHWVWVTLHDPRLEGLSGDVVIRIDGKDIGTLTPKYSAAMRPAVAFIHERGMTTAARAIVKGNQLTTDLSIYCKRAAEITDDWLNSLPQYPEPSTAVLQEPTHTPADWYPDPHGVNRLRYWDGTEWTHHVAN